MRTQRHVTLRYCCIIARPSHSVIASLAPLCRVCLSVPTRIVRNSRMICDGKSSRHEASRCSNSTRAVHALTQGPHVVAVVGPQILCSVVFLQHVRRNEPLCFYYDLNYLYYFHVCVVTGKCAVRKFCELLPRCFLINLMPYRSMMLIIDSKVDRGLIVERYLNHHSAKYQFKLN